MGNCQAAEAAAVLIQKPGGTVEGTYWAIDAGEVMKANPGHYVAAVLAAPPGAGAAGRGSRAPVRQLKLLRPDDTLCLGRVYRLVTFEEVLKELSSRSHSRLSKLRLPQQQAQKKKIKEKEKTTVGQNGRVRCRNDDSLLAEQKQQEDDDGASIAGGGAGSSYGAAASRHGHWKPSLQSISEVGGM